MCSIFGIAGEVTQDKKTRKRLLEELGISGSIRGKQATGISAFTETSLQWIKESTSPIKFDWKKVNKDFDYIIGHTRFATQGKVVWQNNHPFVTQISDNYSFSVTHNGTIYNDSQLKRKYDLDSGNIATDSYVINLLLKNILFTQEKSRIDSDVIKEVAELLQGSFSVVVADTENNIWFFRHKNPLNYIHNEDGFIYGSTRNMLTSAERILNIRIRGEIRQTKEHHIYHYCNEKNTFEDKGKFSPKKFFSRKTGYSRYSAYSDYSSNKSNKNGKTKLKEDGEVIYYNKIRDEYVRFDSQYELSLYFRYGTPNVGEVVELIEKTVCPSCNEKTNIELWENPKVKVNGEKTIIDEFFECPVCQSVISHQNLEVTKKWKK